jgi:hypothetical protein
MMAYSIGNPITGNKEEERFEELDDAEIAALEASIDDALWGVWDEDDGELMSLAFGQKVFN